MSPPQQIIVLGGGGFSMEPKNLALDAYVLEHARSDRPRVLFVPTASGDSDGYIGRFYAAFAGLPCVARHLPLFRMHGRLEDVVMNQDVIYVGGGNTKSMLALWREWGLVEMLRDALQNGTVLAGVSAGAICWFEQGLTDSFPGTLCALDCLGFLPGSCAPHYGDEAERRPDFTRMIEQGSLRAGYGIDDGVALRFANGDLVECVSSRAGKQAFRVQASGSTAIEEAIPARLLPELKPTWPAY